MIGPIIILTIAAGQTPLLQKVATGNPIKIYLDDMRKTPDGFTRTYTVEETIELIKNNDGYIECVSLDNDLGDGLKEGREVMKWIEEQAFNNTLKPIKKLTIHSGNTVALDEMLKARHNAYKFWAQHGFDFK
jgi:hypothetical protein